MINKFVICLLVSTTAHAAIVHPAIVHPLDERHVLEVPISQTGLTRIKVEEDRILHVFGMAGEYVLETDEDQGQVFIRPLSEGGKPINLTLTTEAGHTQDLRLIPKNQAPETLILRVDMGIAEELRREKQASVPLFREEVEELIRACQEERIPLGYKEVPLNLSTLQGPYLLIREIHGQKLRGLTYRVQNNSQDVLALSEPELARRSFQATPKGFDVASSEGGLLPPNALIALLISKKTLTPGEGADIYVVARAN